MLNSIIVTLYNTIIHNSYTPFDFSQYSIATVLLKKSKHFIFSIFSFLPARKIGTHILYIITILIICTISTNNTAMERLSPRTISPRKKNRSFSENTVQQVLSLHHAIQKYDVTRIKNILCPNINEEGENKNTPLIRATQNNYESIVKMLLQKKRVDINRRNIWGNTALHYAALYNYDNLLELFLSDPRFNFSLQNNDCRTAHALLDTGNTKLRHKLFGRTTLDIIITEEAFEMEMCLNSSDSLINQKIEIIKKRFNKDYEQQKDYQELPESTRIAYDDSFIKQAILSRISSSKVAIQEILHRKKSSLELQIII